MSALDWSIVGVYLAGMIGMAVYLGRSQKNNEDYYLGGRDMKWWAIGLSTMATQCSTNSLLGAPAFVAFAVGGGLVWLQYEIAVPISMIALMIFLLPFFRKAKVISIYEYLEDRFGVGTRTLLSVVFQLLRAFSTGVTVYGISIVLQEIIGIPMWSTVVILGVVTVIYDSIGGIKAVVYSDVVQMVILYGGILFAIAFALDKIGGVTAMWSLFDAERKVAIDFSSWGFGEGKTYSFWPMLIGGLFLYVSYYGCDQTQVQRELGAKDEDETNMSLSLNGFMRFPLVLTYCFLGVCIAAFAKLNPEFLDLMPSTAAGTPNFNMAVPMFVIHYLPHGIIGLVMVALFAAAMSSLDSTINSLSATTMRDLYQRFINGNMTEKQEFFWGKVFTVFWGFLCCVGAFFVETISDSIIESINKIGSLLNGPILATFALGILTKRANGQGTFIGIIAGLLFNAFLWKYVPWVSFWWWNVFGAFMTFGVGYILSLAWPAPVYETIKPYLFSKEAMDNINFKRNWVPVYWSLMLYGILITVVLSFF